MRIKILTLLLFIGLTGSLFAQNNSDVRVVIGNLHYYIHTVEKGETLSGIAQTYALRAKQIEEVNPTLGDPQKIKLGQKILIPNFAVYGSKYPVSTWDFELYTVKPSEKLKSIAKLFNSDLKDIKTVNPNVDNKPTAGTQLRIPIKKQQQTNQNIEVKNNINESTSVAKSNSKNPAVAFNWTNDSDEKTTPVSEPKEDCENYTYNSKDVFNIAYLLPFNLESSKPDRNCLSFIEGALLALANQKENKGVSLHTTIIDISDATKLKEALASNVLKNADLIVGPFSLSGLKSISDFSEKNKIPLVAPYDAKAKSLLKSNPYFIQVYPSDESIYDKMCSEDIPNSHPILIHSASPDSTMLANYKKVLKAKYGNFTTVTHAMGQRIEVSKKALEPNLLKSKENLIFVCSNNEAFVSDLMTRLAVLKTSGYPMKVYGRSQWRNFKLVDVAYFFDLEVRMPMPFFVDYSNEEVKVFIQNYRQTYNAEPSQYAFLAYDLSTFFVNALYKNGKNFLSCLGKLKLQSLQTNFRFKQLDTDNGYSNESCFLIKYTPEINIERE